MTNVLSNKDLLIFYHSVLLGAGDNSAGYDSTNQFPMSTLEDPEVQKAMEEHQQVEKMLKDIVQIESMVFKVAELVHEQGEVIVRIEAKVEEALDKTEEGVSQLNKAVEHNQSAFRKKFCIIGIVLIILIIIALIITLSVIYGK